MNDNILLGIMYTGAIVLFILVMDTIHEVKANPKAPIAKYYYWIMWMAASASVVVVVVTAIHVYKYILILAG